jgi:hypothetical protein
MKPSNLGIYPPAMVWVRCESGLRTSGESKATYPGEEITLVMDNARYQRSRLVMEMADALDMELLYLPACTPKINIIERAWRLVKARCLRNKYFPNFTLFNGALDEFLDSPNGKNKEHLKTLVTENFQILQNPKTWHRVVYLLACHKAHNGFFAEFSG